MIADINTLASGSTLNADVCIIGSGAVGITIAREFIGSPYRLIVLEGGGQTFEDRSQEPYRSEVIGLPHNGIHIGRVRVLGGTTTRWAGQSLPLFNIDFAQRDWIPNSGWPISRDSLASFYRRAEQVLQIPHVSYDPSTWPTCLDRPPQYDESKIVTYYSQFSRTPDFAQQYRAAITSAANIQLITHANAVGLEALPQADRIRAVKVRSFQGAQITVEARTFIVCCGGIETARLLLASNSVEPAGIGNRHDVVGRYFQDHPGVIFPVKPRNPKQFSRWYDSFRVQQMRHSIKIAASAKLQQHEKILHVGGEIFYPTQEDDPIEAAKLIVQAIRQPHLRAQVPQSLARVIRRPDKVLKAAYRRYILKQVASVGSTNPYLGLSVEQQPNAESRVTLSQKLDSLGMPRTQLDWRCGQLESRSIGIFARAVAEEWRRLDLADFDPDSVPLQGREKGLHGGFIDASHHMGTTRMGIDPRQSVVDPECRVHGYDNLFIGSSSVFPTSGFSNPTLTLLALALRMADGLKLSLSPITAVAV